VTAEARCGSLPSRRALLAGGVGAAAALVFARSRPAWSASDLIVTTRQGLVAGHIDAGIAVFKGIPYGDDTRAHRFRPPLAHPAWPGVRHEYGPSAPQGSSAELSRAFIAFAKTGDPNVEGLPS
jgi:para-nitrobenzyl esterase